MRIMIDTNIIISAIRNPDGIPFAAYAKAAQPPHKIILCDQIVDEVRKVFNRKFPDSVPLIDKKKFRDRFFVAVNLGHPFPPPLNPLQGPFLSEMCKSNLSDGGRFRFDNPFSLWIKMR